MEDFFHSQCELLSLPKVPKDRTSLDFLPCSALSTTLSSIVEPFFSQRNKYGITYTGKEGGAVRGMPGVTTEDVKMAQIRSYILTL